MAAEFAKSMMAPAPTAKEPVAESQPAVEPKPKQTKSEKGGSKSKSKSSKKSSDNKTSKSEEPEDDSLDPISGMLKQLTDLLVPQ